MAMLTGKRSCRMRWVSAVTLIFAVVAVCAAQQAETIHKPSWGPQLVRKVVPFEVVLKDAAGNLVVYDRHSQTTASIDQVHRIDGKHSWYVPTHVSYTQGKLFGGSPSKPGLEPGEYDVSVVFGRYGKVQARVTAGEKGLHTEMRLPLSRKVVRVRFVDQQGQPLAAIPYMPKFEEEQVYNAVRLGVLPEPVLRLPPTRQEIDGLDEGGGFNYRRARGGGKPQAIVLDNGWCSATVFDGGKGVLKFELGKDSFGVERFEVTAPFTKNEYTAKVTPSRAWQEFDPAKFEILNENDPGLAKHNVPATTTNAAPAPQRLLKFKFSPTIAAWARYGKLMHDGNYVYGRIVADGVFFDREIDSVSWLELHSLPVGWVLSDPDSGSDFASESARRHRDDDQSWCLRTDGTGRVAGVFARLLAPNGTPARFAEASVFLLADDKQAQEMRKLEAELAAAGKRPKPPEHLSTDKQNELRKAAELGDLEMLKEAMSPATYEALAKREHRFRFAKFGAWYDSHQRIDADADGYLIAPHFTLEKGKQYVMYLWHASRDDLKPDARIVIRGEGDVTDLGVIRLPAPEKR